MKYGDPLAGGIFRDSDRQRSTCSIDGCKEHRYARTWCTKHWSRWQKHGSPNWTPSRKPQIPCTVDDCSATAVARKMCTAHYAKWRKHGDPLFVSTPTSRRRATSRSDRAGYVLLYMPEHPNARSGGRVAEHTVVMSQVIGRPLTATENVHHRNGIRDDNRPENLELWNRAQPPGKRPADLITYAREILELYGTDPSKYV